ncbi:ABC transporter permease [Aeribacillus alveayuensis]|uniref:ABC transport system permease protein n=1 Tax=Aeribacillus alveayuensis TaxID=279215 RepID=A0ABT9VSV5_9BACI|nr:putative ABC transport system permease protein [Bacillus alveayuensis]
MNILDNINMALSSFSTHKLRSFLTIIGIIIGVGSVIIVVAIGQGGEAALKTQFAGSGNNTLEITYSPGEGALYALEGMDNQPLFTEEDIYHLKQIPEISQVIPSTTHTAKIYFFKESIDSQIIGITKAYYDVHSITAKEGRLINLPDIEQGKKVAIINEDVAKELFLSVNPIGQIIEIEGIPLKVIGVVEESDGAMNLAMPKVMIPLTTWPILFGTDEVKSITIKAKSVDTLGVAGKKAVDVLNSIKDVEGEYQVFNMKEIEQGISIITRVMTMIIGGIASISLLVGGIGVMNIMLVSVTERTKEIGIRKALGATRANILLQFLIESVILTLIGGVIGIILGVIFANLISYIAKWPSLISLPVILGGLFFSMAIGIIFGLLPANKAAKLDPIDALRYE